MYIIFVLILILLLAVPLYINFQSYREKHGIDIPILMYHDFGYNIDKSNSSICVTPDEFEHQIKYMLDKGYKAITFSELYKYKKGVGKLPNKPFMITMDDGYYSNYKYAYPILKRYNTPATIFVITSYVGKSPGCNPHFSWAQAKEMEQSGLVEIQNHSNNHGNHKNMNKQKIIKSVMDAQKAIDKELGKRNVIVFSYPGGECTKASRHIIKTLGVDIQITTLNGIADKISDLSDTKRISIQHGMKGRRIINKIKFIEIKDFLKSMLHMK